MSTALREAFDDLTADVAPFVVADDLGATAWRTGRRRRARRLLARSALVVAATAALATALLPGLTGSRAVEPAEERTGPGVTGYPERIEDPWWLGDLPDRPGPAAAVLSVVGPENAVGWRVVAEDGRSWRLSPHYSAGGDRPSLSPDGRYLGYRSGLDGPYVLHDLVRGVRHRFAERDPRAPVVWPGYLVTGETPTFWSPDGTRLLVPAMLNFTTPGALVLGVDGSMALVPAVDERDQFRYVPPGELSGWAGDHLLAWVKESGERGTAGYAVTVHVTDPTGAPVRSFPLRPGSPWAAEAALAGQWAAQVSPDGRELLVIEQEGGEQVLRQFAMDDGAELDPPRRVRYPLACGVSWVGGSLAVPVDSRDGDRHRAGTMLSEPDGWRDVVGVDPVLDSRCLIWASDALAGPGHRSLLDIDAWPWTWRWREILAGALLLAVLAWLLPRLVPPARRGARAFRDAFR